MVHAGHRALSRIAGSLLLGFVLIPSVDARPARPAPSLPGPSGIIVNVSTEPQLQAAVAAIASNVTIVLAPGTYRLTRSLYFNRALRNIGVRGATADSSDVQLVGPGMTRIDYGAVPYGIWTGGGVDGITIANMTVRDFYFHPLIFNSGSQRPHVYNVHLIDAGQQFLKSNPDAAGVGAPDGIVEYSIFEFTTTARDDYPKAIDVHGGANWRIRHNLFRNLQAPTGQLIGPAVLVWRGSTGTLTEGNTFINCGRGIMYGAEDAPGSAHSGGIIRNNFFYRSSAQPGDVGIQIADSPGTQVLNNTVILSGTYPAAIEYRYAGTTGAVIANNLADGTIWAREGATAALTANFVNAVPAMFVNAAAGDLHLLPAAVMAINQGMTTPNADNDWDGEMRPSGAGFDIGADEQGATSTTHRIAGRLTQLASGGPLAGVTVTLTGTRSQSTVRRHASEDGLLTLWPDEYRTWAAGQGLLEPDRAVRVMNTQPDRTAIHGARTGPRLEITGPPEGATYLIDPTLRMELQTLPLRVVGAAGRVGWTVNGRRVGSKSEDGGLSWPLERGMHQVRARDGRGRVAEASILVK